MSLTIDGFRQEFENLVRSNNVNWEVHGFLGPNGLVFPFGTDSKVISTVFETFVAPIVTEIAAAHGYVVEGADQTIYPDFTLTPKGCSSNRIAIDVKTTYRRFNRSGKVQPFRFTLGSYTSFLRHPDQTKNILHPYIEYSGHWIIGFLYSRKQNVPAKLHMSLKGLKPFCPYENVEFFVQEKHLVAGDSPGSGNTANIGSFPTARIEDLRDGGKGPFKTKSDCDKYWRNYKK